MRNFHARPNQHFCPTLNLDKLWTLVGEDERVKFAEAKDGNVPVVDLVQFVSFIFYLFSFGILSDDIRNGRS